jgi:hypothetical protein
MESGWPGWPKEAGVAFILALVLFVIILGVLDARLPWPNPKSKGS